MASSKKPTLPESVADKFKYTGKGQRVFYTKPIPEVGRVKVDVEKLTPELAEKVVDHVPFLSRNSKPKSKTKKTEE